MHTDTTHTQAQPETQVGWVCRSVVKFTIAAKQCLCLCKLASGAWLSLDGHFHLWDHMKAREILGTGPGESSASLRQGI